MLIVVTSCSRYGYLAFVSVVVERRKNNKISLSCVLFGRTANISRCASRDANHWQLQRTFTFCSAVVAGPALQGI